MPKDEFAHEDPMEMVGMVVPGDSETMDAMAEALVEEYVRMGWDEARLMPLFTNPMYLATHRIYREKGVAYVIELIHKVRNKWNIPNQGAS